MGREFELKYRVTPEQLAQIRRQYDGFATIQMETTYYDTPSGILGRLHWTLRRRMENGVSVCTLKSDLPDGSRGEWEVCCAHILEAVPQLIALGAPGELAQYTAAGVIPTCGARFTRQAALIQSDDTLVELALDQGVLTGGGREAALSEAEVELKRGQDAGAVRFARQLAAQFGLTPEPKSKFRRALELSAGTAGQCTDEIQLNDAEPHPKV